MQDTLSIVLAWLLELFSGAPHASRSALDLADQSNSHLMLGTHLTMPLHFCCCCRSSQQLHLSLHISSANCRHQTSLALFAFMSRTASPLRYLYTPPIFTFDTNLDEAAVGRRDSASSNDMAQSRDTAHMNDHMYENMNPDAMPFQPGRNSNNNNHTQRARHGLISQQIPPPVLPHTNLIPHYNVRGPSWNWTSPSLPPLPPFQPYSHFASVNQDGYCDYASQQQVLANYPQWTPNERFSNQAYAAPYGPPMFYQQQQQPGFERSPFPHLHDGSGFPPHVHCATSQQTGMFDEGNNKNSEYADRFTRRLELMNRTTNISHRVSAKKAKQAKTIKAKNENKEGYYHRLGARAQKGYDLRTNKASRASPSTISQKKGRYGDTKIMLPAPQPLELYLKQAFAEPIIADTPNQILVVLDLNGTVLYRPNRNAKTMIPRPHLKPFLRYLFHNFKVMVWSSAQPTNVKSLVEQAVDKDLRSMLVDIWARDTFGLSPKNYSQNVQVYKNLKLIWSRDVIQQHHPKYAVGERFGQHNTILIDDSALKASAQPYNLLQIPEFRATPEQMQGDVLCEVAGYLELLRQQADVSSFVRIEPFKEEGRWTYEWPAETVEEIIKISNKEKATSSGKRKKPALPASSMSQVTNTFSSVSLGVLEQQAT